MTKGTSRLAPFAAGLLLVAFACSGSPGGGGAYRIATASVKSDAYHLARLQGVLGGHTNDDGTACLTIGSTALMWPYGYSAGGEPLTVYDDQGHAVASVGQRVVFAGGLLGDGVHALLGCDGFSDFWGVGHVEEARWT